MHSVYLPLHVWDREFESRLVIAYLEAMKGNMAILGHEYNIAELYAEDSNALLFRAGGPLNHSVRGRWHNLITSNGGAVITQDEEGINNMPFIFEKTVGKPKAKLDIEKIKQFPQTANLNAFKDVSLQLAWSNLHRAYISHQISETECRTHAVNKILDTSSVRFDLLGELGLLIQERTINSIHSLFGKYVLILDNFSVDHRGLKNMIDPSNDLKQAGWEEEEIEKYVRKKQEDRSIEKNARTDFSKIIESLAQDNPNINFVFRPHPVLEPSFWHQQFSGYKNISIIDKGSIHAWIYGSIATIHSGCTTGLEAYGAGKRTIDISSLISKRTESIQSSLIGQSAKKIDNYSELNNSIKKLWIRDNHENSLKQTIKSIISESEECNQSKPVDNALNIIKCNSVQVAENIQSQLNLANTEDVFGSKSAIVRICGASNQLGQQSRGKNYNSILSNSTGKMSPNLGKSRYVSKQEARNKLRDICIAFTKLGITMPPISIRQIGVNSFAVFRGQ